MSANLDKLSQRYASLTLREQRLVIGTILVLFWAGWDSFIHQPQIDESKRLTQSIEQMQQLLTSQQATSVELEKINKQDPNLQNRQNLSLLKTSISRLQQQLSAGGKRFVPSQQMATALRDMLKQHGKLTLVSLETLPAKTFGSDTTQSWVYRHTLSLTLQGDYFSTLDYLKGLEALPWRIHWDSIDYGVTNYPLAETHIQVYTLSFEQDWLGV